MLKGRSDFSAFIKGTGLREILSERKVSTLALCGLLTNICVEETARAAYASSEIGFCDWAEEWAECKNSFGCLPDLKEVYVLGDGCAAMSLQEHDRALTVSIPLSATVLSCSEYLRRVLNIEPQPQQKQQQQPSGGGSDGDEYEYKPSFWARHGNLIFLFVVAFIWALINGRK